MSYNTHPWARGRGLTARAVRLAATYAINAGVDRIVVLTRDTNAASRRVAEQSGFVFEGIARGAELHRDSRYDMAQYGLLATDVVA